MLPTSTRGTAAFQDRCVAEKWELGRWAPCSRSWSRPRLIAFLQRLSEPGPGEPALQEGRWTLRKGRELLPETTPQVSAAQPPRPAHFFQSHCRWGDHGGESPWVSHLWPTSSQKAQEGLFPLPHPAPAGGLVTPSLREIEDEGLQRPFSPPPLPWELLTWSLALVPRAPLHEQPARPGLQGPGQGLRPAN